MSLAETREGMIHQKFLALEMWTKRARDLTVIGVAGQALDALKHCRDCLYECERVLKDES